MKKLVVLTNVLMRMRAAANPDLDLADQEAMKAVKVVRAASIPRAFLLADLREKRTFRHLARKLGSFIMLITFYATALLLDRNISTRYSMGQVLSKELLETSRAPSGVTFDSGIMTIDDFWDWFGHSFLPTVYTATTSSGMLIPRELRDTIGTRSKILGGFNIIQHRYLAINTSSPEHKNNLCYSKIPAGKDLTCYSTSGASTESFGSVEAAGSTGSDDELQALEMFHYSVNSEGVGGFQTYFLRSTTGGVAELARAQRMEAYGWIGPQTRAVDIVIPIYNLHLKLAGVVRMTLESSLAGEIKGSSSISVMNAEPYNLDVPENFVRFVCEVIYASLVFICAGVELWSIVVVSRCNLCKYIARHGVFEALSELLSVSLNLYIIVLRVMIMTSDKRRMLTSVESFDTYVPLTAFITEDDVYIGLNTLNVMVLGTRMFTYFRVTSGGARLIKSVAGAMPDVLSFLPIYVAVIVSYALAGHVLFGLSFAEWSTIQRALCRVIEINFGLYDPSAIYDASGVFGFFFTSSSCVVFCIIMLNVFLAIIMSTWETFTEKAVAQAKIRDEYLDEMCFAELVALMLLREVVLDSLVLATMHIDDHETVTRALLDERWRAEHKHIPEWVRRRVLRWYWNSDDGAALVGPNANQTNAAVHARAHPESHAAPTSSSSLDNPELLHDRSNANDVVPHHRRLSTTRVTPI